MPDVLEGVQTEEPNQRVSVVRFCEEFLYPDDVVWFERKRRKRQLSVYDTVGSVSVAEQMQRMG